MGPDLFGLPLATLWQAAHCCVNNLALLSRVEVGLALRAAEGALFWADTATDVTKVAKPISLSAARGLRAYLMAVGSVSGCKISRNAVACDRDSGGSLRHGDRNCSA